MFINKEVLNVSAQINFSREELLSRRFFRKTAQSIGLRRG